MKKLCYQMEKQLFIVILTLFVFILLVTKSLYIARIQGAKAARFSCENRHDGLEGVLPFVEGMILDKCL